MKHKLDSDIVLEAKKLALHMHGDQDHGSLKISDHLEAVTDKLWEYGMKHVPEFQMSTWNSTMGLHIFPWVVIATGYLHDTLEDTELTKENILTTFPTLPELAQYVDQVTDAPGKTRLERHIKTYYRSRKNFESTFVKMCDRWHNQKRCFEQKEIKFGTQYANEYAYFKFSLYDNDPRLEELWKELDRQVENLIGMINSDRSTWNMMDLDIPNT